jgi:hypothetical protein
VPIPFYEGVPDGESINFSKIDLSDGFWRMIVPEADCWHFAYVLPDAPGEPTRLVIPHALQMGWTQSSGFISAVTETVRDIIQVLVEGNESMPPHTMETSMFPERPAKRQWTSNMTWQMSSVFVDNFMLAAVENEEGTLLSLTARAALHSIHGVFPPPSTSGHKVGKNPVLEKELERGDARWESKKEILGFLPDGSPSSGFNNSLKNCSTLLVSCLLPSSFSSPSMCAFEMIQNESQFQWMAIYAICLVGF